MVRRDVVPACLFLTGVLLVPQRGWAQATPADAPPAQAQSTEVEAIKQELAQLRAEFEQVRARYDERLSALEKRLAELGVAPAPAPGEPQPSAAPAPPAQPELPPAEPVPPAATSPPAPQGQTGGFVQSSKIFNPDIAVIGDFLGAAGGNTIDNQPSLEMHEVETSFQAIVDPYAKADFFLAFSPEGAEIEEGFITFTSLPGALLLKVGKMRASFGKVNQTHNHALSWTDRPLVTQNLVGGEEGISDAGLSVSRLLLNPLFFLEATGEVYRGDDAVFQTNDRRHLTYLGRLRGYRDLTEGTNLDVGTSIAYGPTDLGPDTWARLIGVDATFRYRPLRRAIYKRVLARTELVWSRQNLEGSHQSAFGYYVSGDYQFARRWFVGARYDTSDRALDSSLDDKGGALLLTFWPSEFSQVRGQYRHTKYAEGETANEFLFQFLFSIGAHGAHVF
jgi:hypothetical protein